MAETNNISNTRSTPLILNCVPRSVHHPSVKPPLPEWRCVLHVSLRPNTGSVEPGSHVSRFWFISEDCGFITDLVGGREPSLCDKNTQGRLAARTFIDQETNWQVPL